jgi:hypothetical protein
MQGLVQSTWDEASKSPTIKVSSRVHRQASKRVDGVPQTPTIKKITKKLQHLFPSNECTSRISKFYDEISI